MCLLTLDILKVGSILHFAKTDDVVWGTGVNGKISPEAHNFNRLDIRAVRWPLTRDFLMARNIPVPEIYGEPGLLTPLVFPHLKTLAKNPKIDVTIIPNYNNLPFSSNRENVLNQRSGLLKFLERIAQSKFVVGSSLHAIVITESLGIPVRLIKSSVEMILNIMFIFLEQVDR
jgi:pyruvyltransferase